MLVKLLAWIQSVVLFCVEKRRGSLNVNEMFIPFGAVLPLL